MKVLFAVTLLTSLACPIVMLSSGSIEPTGPLKTTGLLHVSMTILRLLAAISASRVELKVMLAPMPMPLHVEKVILSAVKTTGPLYV